MVISVNFRGSRGRGTVEPLGASFSWLLLSFESRGPAPLPASHRSRCKNTRLAGLQLEPPVKPEPEPCQTGPTCVYLPCGLNLHQVTIIYIAK
jgi:hypothetical protein